MLLEGSYLGDVEKVVESFRLIRRDMIRGGEINVRAKFRYQHKLLRMLCHNYVGYHF